MDETFKCVLTIYLLGAVLGAMLMWLTVDGMRITYEAKVVATVIMTATWPVVAIAAVAKLLYMLPGWTYTFFKIFKRGIVDLYRTAKPTKNEIPRAKIVER